jgi:hypothetical protein
MLFRETPFHLQVQGVQEQHLNLVWACANFLQNKKGSVK